MSLKCSPHIAPSGVPCIRPPKPLGPGRPQLPVMSVNGKRPNAGGDVEVIIPEVVPPSVEGAGKAADAKATYEALETKASNADLDAEVERAKKAEAALGKAIEKKVDAEEGKGLSTKDYTPEEKEKLKGIEAGAQKNVPPIAPSVEGAGKAADAKATYEALKAKADKSGLEAEVKRAKEVERGLVERITELEDDEGGGVAELMVEATHADLVTLRDNGALIPGMQYRITDYVATTVQEHTQSANHPFDIIVTADSANKLNEVARAIRHNGDTYFPKTTKFEAWQIWYRLDNDTKHFEWADEVNGKGVIYRMIDEFNNDIPYDFKGIKMQAYLGYDEVTGENMFSEDHRYTFGIDVDDTLQGNSRENVIKSFDFQGRLSIVRNTFGSSCNNNFLDVNCNDNTFGSECDRNILGAYCIINKFGNKCKENRIGFDGYGNTFGSNCRSNTFNARCNDNTLSDSCGSNVFGTLCTYNTLGSYCFRNTLGSYCSRNTLGSFCHSNTFGPYCTSNTFDSDCVDSTFGSDCNDNNFGSDCYDNNFGSDCNDNTFGSGCSFNTFGSGCDTNTFGSNCSGNTFDSGCYDNTLYAFFSKIILQNSVSENTIDCTADRGEYEYCKNIEIKSGVIGKEIYIDGVEQSYHTEIRPENSITISI